VTFVRYHWRPRLRAAAWSLAGFTLLELAATMVLIVLNAGVYQP
jgi:prepilin-type N-terminal cleavage/methylation domain-containing protein